MRSDEYIDGGDTASFDGEAENEGELDGGRESRSLGRSKIGIQHEHLAAELGKRYRKIDSNRGPAGAAIGARNREDLWGFAALGALAVRSAAHEVSQDH